MLHYQYNTIVKCVCVENEIKNKIIIMQNWNQVYFLDGKILKWQNIYLILYINII